MAKKPQKLIPLTMTEIILRGDAETIRQALEARTQIDTLLEEREAAYQRIVELETQVCEIVGEDGIFPFPSPPMEVADYATPAMPKKKADPAVTPEATPAKTTEVKTDDAPATKADADAKPTEEKSANDSSDDAEPESKKTDDA